LKISEAWLEIFEKNVSKIEDSGKISRRKWRQIAHFSRIYILSAKRLAGKHRKSDFQEPMADIKHTTSSGSVAVEVQADLGSSSLEAAVDEENSLPSDDESIIGSDDSNDSSGEEESGDQGSASEINVPTAADQKEGTSPTSRPKGNAPRRSKRSNFGNRYEQAISKEKEDDLKPPLRRNGNLLLGSWIIIN
jgi:hypothetical protein